jgi:hypothetical protein
MEDISASATSSLQITNPEGSQPSCCKDTKAAIGEAALKELLDCLCHDGTHMAEPSWKPVKLPAHIKPSNGSRLHCNLRSESNPEPPKYAASESLIV